MTIKGINNSISFPATVAVKDGAAIAKGAATLDRTKFGFLLKNYSFLV
ncbi:YceI family protein [Pontibacter silvestris]|nr:YceI family protein [Pontibacter silvestris]